MLCFFASLTKRIEFELIEGEQTKFNLQSDGLYKVTVNRNEIGIDLTLSLNDDGTISIDGISEVRKPVDGASEPVDGTGKPADGAITPANGTGKPADGTSTPVGQKSPQTGDYISIWFWTVLVFIVGGIVIKLAVYDRKKKSAD